MILPPLKTSGGNPGTNTRRSHAENDYCKPKFYALVEFPYPSGQGLHIGHPRPYTAMDIVSRKRRTPGLQRAVPDGLGRLPGLRLRTSPSRTRYTPPSNKEQRRTLQGSARGPRCVAFDWDREIKHHRSRLLQVDAVDIPQAVQGGTCVQRK